ncbi:DUF6906 family protein [Paenibacillus antarcticus]|uniref:DUF6906 family protein n=1 Tax=Paenibacillus antarcticus TaxID=253703 RepID=UPI000AFAEAE2|nr:hypothetical protein [Paenibacillus antarcticus]
MKNGKRPTRRQLSIISESVATPADWLVSKSTSNELHLVHRYAKQTKIIWL